MALLIFCIFCYFVVCDIRDDMWSQFDILVGLPIPCWWRSPKTVVMIAELLDIRSSAEPQTITIAEQQTIAEAKTIAIHDYIYIYIYYLFIFCHWFVYLFIVFIYLFVVCDIRDDIWFDWFQQIRNSRRPPIPCWRISPKTVSRACGAAGDPQQLCGTTDDCGTADDCDCGAADDCRSKYDCDLR